MTVSIVINILLSALVGILVAVGVYKSTGQNIYKKVVYLIEEANKLDLLGPEKMDKVVDGLYDMVPAAYREKLNKEELRKEAQKIYNKMKDFSKSEAEKK